MADRDKHICMAKLAEQAEKYDGKYAVAKFGVQSCVPPLHVQWYTL